MAEKQKPSKFTVDDGNYDKEYIFRKYGIFILNGSIIKVFLSANLCHRIDAVRGVIEMNHPDSKNHLYKAVIN
uniref:DUF223 domain-containing protein n=1 Tax=Heterorhabditis bacteriophora TaxID=37862 RepID=A0A1I7WMX0_HETBA